MGNCVQRFLALIPYLMEVNGGWGGGDKTDKGHGLKYTPTQQEKLSGKHATATMHETKSCPVLKLKWISQQAFSLLKLKGKKKKKKATISTGTNLLNDTSAITTGKTEIFLLQKCHLCITQNYCCCGNCNLSFLDFKLEKKKKKPTGRFCPW